MEHAVDESAIELRKLSKHYGQQVVLPPLDLSIRDGEFFCLVGPSGCGKTTTLNLIGGFVGPTSGEIYLRGKRVDRMPPHKRSVNTVFQSYALFPHMNVEDNVGFGLKMAGVRRREAMMRVQETLEKVGLGDCRKRSPVQLSGGQQQRVAVARALVNRPAVLLLDEPLGALDLKFRKHLQFELAAIQRDVGTTFVHVTHDQEEAMAMADRIAVLNDGRLEQVGSPRDVYQRPRSRFVADFVGESNLVPVRVDDPRAGLVELLDGRPLPPVTVPAECGDRATLMVRPEAVTLTNEHAHDRDLQGRIEQVVFLGGHVRTVVEVDLLDVPIVVTSRGRDPAAVSLEPAKGDRVFLHWSRTAAVVLPDDPATKDGDDDGGV